MNQDNRYRASFWLDTKLWKRFHHVVRKQDKQLQDVLSAMIEAYVTVEDTKLAVSKLQVTFEIPAGGEK